MERLVRLESELKVKVLVAQLCPVFSKHMDCSPPGSSVHGILQARILEWVAVPFSRDLPDPGVKPGCPALPADSLPSEPPGKPSKDLKLKQKKKKKSKKIKKNPHFIRKFTLSQQNTLSFAIILVSCYYTLLRDCCE